MCMRRLFSQAPQDKPPVDVAVKVAGIHWCAAALLPPARGSRSLYAMSDASPSGVRRWYNSPSHAAEMTAGYYNYFGRCGYTPIAKALKQRRCGLCFTCVLTPEGVRPHALILCKLITHPQAQEPMPWRHHCCSRYACAKTHVRVQVSGDVRH